MQKGEPLPEGILLDPGGRPTTDPSALFATPAGALLPFGEHKGFGLALACELLAGALTGGETQTGAKADGITNSMLSIVLSPECFAGAHTYSDRLETLASWVASEGTTDRPIHLPGDPERTLRSLRLAFGIPVDPATWAGMIAAAAAVGVPDFWS